MKLNARALASVRGAFVVRHTDERVMRQVEACAESLSLEEFTNSARSVWGRAGLSPSLGSVGDPYDNAVVESFWARLQVEVLNRRRWNTRIELANAIFEYIEGFHNRRRRHSALGWTSPIEYENTHTQAAQIAAAPSP